MVSVGYCNQRSVALNDTTWTITTYLATSTTRRTTTNRLTTRNNQSTTTTTLPFAPGKSFYGGYFTFTYLSNTTSVVNYELDFTFMVHNNSFLRQYNCYSNTSRSNLIQFFNTSDFSVNCLEGCTSLSNSTLLGYTNGICLSQSAHMGWTLIKSTFQVVGIIRDENLRIIHEPQDLLFIDWFELNHYFADIGGYLFKLNSSLHVRPDSGLFNRPPVVMFPMITTIQSTDKYVELFHIPVMDDNDDKIQCNSTYFSSF